MKRFAFKLLVFVLAGAIINVAVAWGCASLIRLGTPDVAWLQMRNNPAGGLHFAMCAQRPGASQTNFCWYLNRAKINRDSPTQSQRYTIAFLPALNTPKRRKWADLPPEIVTIPQSRLSEADRSGLSSYRCVLDSRGWPMLALYSKLMASHDPSKIEACERAITIGEWQSVNSHVLSKIQVLPFGIVPPGFAINTIFYAAILWMIFVMPFAIRRRRRIKRGLCARCAYPVGRGATNDTCTECGAAVKPQRGAGM